MIWQSYNYIAGILFFAQLVFLVQSFRNYRYAIKKSKVVREKFKPATLLTVPCKGIDSAFDKNITSFFMLDYDNYYLHFVVEDPQDPAYSRLCHLRDIFASKSKAVNIDVLIAGKSSGCSQKIHNLLYSCSHSPEDVEVFAFADSDACIKSNWLIQLVGPLRKDKYGAATGYRWFVPIKNNFATLALSAINGKIAQLLGNTHFNQAWGGSMAIKKQNFYDIGLDSLWAKAVSDDLCLSYAVKKNRRKVVFVPLCLVASYEQTTWSNLFEFARRQFLITRVTLPGTWIFGLFSSLFAVTGSWIALAAAVIASINPSQLMNIPLYYSVAILFFSAQITRAVLRQKMIFRLLPEDRQKMKTAAIADISLAWLWSWLMLIIVVSSSVGRTITWRNIKYRLTGRTEVEIIR